MMTVSQSTRGRVRVAAMLSGLMLVTAAAIYGQGKYWWAPGSIKDVASCILWSAGTFCALAMIRPRWQTRPLAVLTLLIVWAVEFSQLSHWSVLEAARHTRIGLAIVGANFQWMDLIGQAMGVVIVAGLDVLLRPEKRR